MQNKGESVLTPQPSPKDEAIINPGNLIEEQNAKLLLENEALKKDLQKEKFHHQNLYNQWNELNVSLVEKERELKRLKSTQNPKLKIYQYAFYALLLLTALSVIFNFYSFTNRGNKNPGTAQISSPVEKTNTSQAISSPTQKQAIPANSTNKIPAKYLIKGKSYFYNKPDSNTQRKTFVLPSNDAYGILTALHDQNGFIYVVFTNHAGRTSKGWISKNDLQPLE